MQRLIARTRALIERPWSARVAAWQRDLATLVGPTPRSPVVRSAPPVASGMARGVRWLCVAAVERVTADAVMITFEPLPDVPAADATGATGAVGAWQAGQFLTLTVDVGGARHRRAYSICVRAAAGQGPAIVVKRVANGRVSGWLVEHAAPGMRFEVRGPSGQFVLPPPAADRGDSPDAAPAATPDHVVLIGGGSGITPLVALAEEVLARGGRVSLVYGNRALADVIFQTRLDALAAASDGRLVVRHCLEQPPAAWSGVVGRLTSDTLVAELGAIAALADARSAIYSCGPAPMMDAVREATARLHIDRARLHEERFQSLGERRAAASARAQSLRIAIGAATHEVIARPGATLLEAGLAAGLPMPFSCTMGGCGACKVRVRGDVVHDEPNGLTPDEAAAGHAFACVARPLGPCHVEVPA